MNQVLPAKRRKKTTPSTPSNPNIRSDLQTPVPPVLDDESEWNAAVNKARKATREQHIEHNDMPDATTTMKVCLRLCRYVYACRFYHINVCISLGGVVPCRRRADVDYRTGVEPKHSKGDSFWVYRKRSKAWVEGQVVDTRHFMSDGYYLVDLADGIRVAAYDQTLVSRKKKDHIRVHITK